MVAPARSQILVPDVESVSPRRDITEPFQRNISIISREVKLMSLDGAFRPQVRARHMRRNSRQDVGKVRTFGLRELVRPVGGHGPSSPAECDEPLPVLGRTEVIRIQDVSVQAVVFEYPSGLELAENSGASSDLRNCGTFSMTKYVAPESRTASA